MDHKWHDSYNGAPSDGKGWATGGDSALRVRRGGSWNLSANFAARPFATAFFRTFAASTSVFALWRLRGLPNARAGSLRPEEGYSNG